VGRRSEGGVAAWLFGPAPQHAMVVLRIALGSILLSCYAWRFPYVPVLYGPEGFAGPSYVAPLGLEGPLVRNLLDPFYVLQHVASPALVWGLYALLLGASLAFVLGWRTRASGAVALALHLIFYARNPWAYWGWGRMLVPFLLYAVLAPSGRYFSLDALRRRRRRGGAPLPPRRWQATAWPLRLVQLHVCTQYLALWPRLESETWLHGRMLFAALVNRHYGRFDFDWVPHQELLAVLGVTALVLEVGAPIALWLPRVGGFWALALMGLHLNIELTATVGWWNWLMIAALVAFLPEGWLLRAFERVVRAPPRPPRGSGGSQPSDSTWPRSGGTRPARVSS